MAQGLLTRRLDKITVQFISQCYTLSCSIFYIPSRTTSLLSFFNHSMSGLNFSSSSFCCSISSSGSRSVCEIQKVYDLIRVSFTLVTKFETCFGDVLERYSPWECSQYWAEKLIVWNALLPFAKVADKDFVQRLCKKENFVSTSMKPFNKNTLGEFLNIFSHLSKVENLASRKVGLFLTCIVTCLILTLLPVFEILRL